MKFKLWISLLVILGMLLVPIQFVDAVAFIQGKISYFDDLLDVNITAPTDNYIVYWNDTASEWQARAESTFSWDCSNLSSCNISNLAYVNATAPSDNDILYWNNTDGEWKTKTEGTFTFNCSNLSLCNISSLSDVNTSSVSDNDFFYWNNTASEWQTRAESTFNWSCSNLSGCSLNDTGDVYAPSPGDQYFLYWDSASGNWTNRILVAADIPNLNTSKITTGTFTMARLPVEVKTAGIIFIIDGVGSAITTGEKGHLEIPFNCTIQQATLTADQDGSIVIDVWKDTYANYPPTDADTITSATPPTITTALKSQDSTLTSWTTTIDTGDILAFNVDSCTNITRITLSLVVART